MTQAKHTPGPWQAEWSTREAGKEAKGWHVFNEDDVDYNGVIADCPDCNENSEANARLIAAAPELLQCLLHARMLVAAQAYGEGVIAALAMYDAAIAKATGGAA